MTFYHWGSGYTSTSGAAAENFADTDAQGLIGLWDFLKGTETKDTALGDGLANNGTLCGDACVKDGQLHLDGYHDYFSVKGDKSAFDLQQGTIEVQFTQASGCYDNDTILSRGEECDKDKEGYFDISVTKYGAVTLSHYANGKCVNLKTANGLFKPGDVVNVTYQFDAASGGTFTVTNETTGKDCVIEHTTKGLDFDIGDNDDEEITIGAREYDDACYDKFFKGTIDYVAIYDSSNPDETGGDGDGYVEGTEGNDLIDLAYTGDPEGDKVDNGDAILAGANPDDDIILAGKGDDTVYAGAGDDVICGDDAQVTDKSPITITIDSASAGYTNKVYAYEIDPATGKLTNVVLLTGSAKDSIGQTYTYNASEGALIGVAIQNKDGQYFTSGYDGRVNYNSDCKVHTKALGENADGSVQLGFEDYYGLGDKDYNDVVFTVDLGTSGASFDNAHYDYDSEVGSEIVEVGAGNDVLYGEEGDDLIKGGAGNDYLDGGVGDDTLEGGVGNDTLVGGDGNDDLYGNDGDDKILFGNGDDYVEGGAGNDFIDDIEGAVGNGNDTILAGEGDDTVYAGNGNDEIYGNEGKDLLFGEDGNDTILGGDDNDTIYGGNGDDSLLGEAGDDSIFGEGGEDTIDGGDGNDTIYGGADDDSIRGGAGNDDIYGEGGFDTIDAGAGDDTVHGGELADSILGGDGNDTILGDQGNDTLIGGAGDDTLRGEFGDDYLEGNEGKDSISGGEGDDTLYGGADDDLIRGGSGNDELYGEEGNDTLDSGSADDYLDGGVGDDSIFSGGGRDTVIGGDGNDTIVTSGNADALPDRGYEGAFDADADPENDRDYVDAGEGNNAISTGDDRDTIISGSGNDSIDAGFDDDSITSGAGDDFIIGGEGNDTILAGDGNDTIYAGGDSEFDEACYVPDETDKETNNGNDLVYAGAGNDVIFGADDSDTIYGEAGDDYIDGQIDADSLFGGAGNDTLNSGFDTAADYSEGGADQDTFIGAGAGDTVDGGTDGNDVDTLDMTGLTNWRVTDQSVDADGDSTSGTISFFDDLGNVTGTLKFNEIENIIPCFTPGTVIATPYGERLVEELEAGDRIITRDNGIQRIRWVGAKQVSGADMKKAPHLRPIMIKAGALGNGLPERDIVVSPNHRMLVSNEKTSLYFDEAEVLAAAKHLIGSPGIYELAAPETTYIHFMFDRHEVVLSNGAWSESFQPGDYSLKGIGNAQRNEIFELFPELREQKGLENFEAARRSLKKHEAKLLVM